MLTWKENTKKQTNEGIWPQKISNFMHGIKSAKLAISKVALILCLSYVIESCKAS